MGRKHKSWSTWITSDPHWGHDNVINFCDRPFKDMQDMMKKHRANWNNKVKPEDQVIVVGDVFFYLNKTEAKEYLDSLNGRKILVRGNHDRKPREMNAMGFEFVCEEMTLLIANERVTISHYPFRAPEHVHFYFNLKHKICKFLGIKGTWALDRRFYTRRPVNKGQFLIHGHTHNKLRTRGRQIHVGMDAWDQTPVNINTIANLIASIKREEDESFKRGFSRKIGKARKKT